MLFIFAKIHSYFTHWLICRLYFQKGFRDLSVCRELKLLPPLIKTVVKHKNGIGKDCDCKDKRKVSNSFDFEGGQAEDDRGNGQGVDQIHNPVGINPYPAKGEGKACRAERK